MKTRRIASQLPSSIGIIKRPRRVVREPIVQEPAIAMVVMCLPKLFAKKVDYEIKAQT